MEPLQGQSRLPSTSEIQPAPQPEEPRATLGQEEGRLRTRHESPGQKSENLGKPAQPDAFVAGKAQGPMQPLLRRLAAPFGCFAPLAGQRSAPKALLSSGQNQGIKDANYEKALDARRVMESIEVLTFGVVVFDQPDLQAQLPEFFRNKNEMHIHEICAGPVSELATCAAAKDFFLFLSNCENVQVFVKTYAQKKSKNQEAGKGCYAKAPARDRHGAIRSVGNRHLPQVKPSTAIALNVLASGDYETFATICSLVPEVVVPEIISIKIKGNILNWPALRILLTKLVPVPEDYSCESAFSKHAADIALRKYFEYTNENQFESKLSPGMRTVHHGGKYRDVLVQQGAPFVGEVIRMVNSFSGPGFIGLDLSDEGSFSALKKQVEVEAKVCAAIVANAFKYVCRYSDRLERDKQGIRSALDTVSSAIGISMDTASSAVPAGALAMAATSSSLDLLSSLAYRLIVRPSTLMDSSEIAALLAEFSNLLKDRSFVGQFVPGLPEGNSSMIVKLGHSSELFDRINYEKRLELGKIFFHQYGMYLKRYDRGPLEREVLEHR